MITSVLLILFGFLLLIKGADWLVEGSTGLAKKFKVSDLAIGLTIVAFGTSAPELVVNTVASLDASADLVFGNVIGSNIFNLFVILGIVGIIFPIRVQSSTVWKEIPWSLLAVLILYFLVNSFSSGIQNQLTRYEGLILLVMFVLFLWYVFKQLQNDEEARAQDEVSVPTWRIWLMITVGLAGLIWGGRLVVTHASEIAATLGVSQKIIGLTIVAAGTSLPELVTSVMAAFRKNSDIAIGNIVGSNIFNILLVLPISALANPVVYNTQFNTELMILAAGTIFLFVAMFTGKKYKLDRWEAGLLLAAFIVYTAYTVGSEL